MLATILLNIINKHKIGEWIVKSFIKVKLYYYNTVHRNTNGIR